MNKSFYKPLKFAAIGAVISAGVFGAQAQSFTMQIIADNDFAIFGGTSTGVTSLLYQNNSSWPTQLNNLSSFTFELQPGQDTFYVLGMGGGGMENISGTINDIDMTSISVLMSSDLSSFLTGYFSDGLPSSSVGDGTYDASLFDLQTAFPNLTWGSTTLTDEADDVAASSPNGLGFHFDDSTAHFFSFNASDVGVTPAPEPSTLAMAAMGGFGSLLLFRRRK
ncbi:MAG: PEP-CTERM sorting domain-containing protein [Limisphaerales bacterium]